MNLDPFTQHMLEKAEQRSRALGISNTGNFSLAECSSDAKGTNTKPTASSTPSSISHAAPKPLSKGHSSFNKMQVVEKVSGGLGSPEKKLRQFTALDKENMDLGIEINITTDKHVEVEVHVEEKDNTDDEDEQQQQLGEQTQTAKIRDTSRNRLQRLCALYTNPNDLSSPIHRTEEKFHADSPSDNATTSSNDTRQRFGKLAALASTINQWEDDTSHPSASAVKPPPKPTLASRQKTADASLAPPKPSLPSRRTNVKDDSESMPKMTKTPTETAFGGTDNREIVSSNKKNQFKWDPKVINSLEAQGFQRRESSNFKLAYEYAKVDDEQQQQVSNTESTKPTSNTKSSIILPAKHGLVSGRAALFESKTAASAQQGAQARTSGQKDPTELSLKERMQLFERNKGEALLPKAAFGMAPAISKIRQDMELGKKEEKKGAVLPCVPRTTAGGKVRDTVAALVAATATTISEHQIKSDLKKQRLEEMKMLENRFHLQKKKYTNPNQDQGEAEVAQKEEKAKQEEFLAATNVEHRAAATVPPPPPPPMPPMPPGNLNTLSTKRPSPGNTIDKAEEIKRARKSNTASISRTGTKSSRLYPALSDYDLNEEENTSGGGYTTATVSEGGAASSDPDNNENDSCMDSDADDSSAGICNVSLGREIMQVVQKNDKNQQHLRQQKQNPVKGVRYAEKNQYYDDGNEHYDTSMNDSSEESLGVDDYLDEALNIDEQVDDGDDDDTDESVCDEENTSHTSKGSKGTTSSNSFSFRKTPRKCTNFQPISEEEDKTPLPVTSQLSVNRDEDDNTVTLVHTVSFYRRQQNANSANSTPVRKTCREQQVLRSAVEKAASFASFPHERQHLQCDVAVEGSNGSSPDTQDNDSQSELEEDDKLLVQEKIRKLLDEVCKQQQVIAQTSQALNLCAATIEFSGSSESVEGERHLLVATHRRQACLDEVQRLRVEKRLRPLGAPKERGRLTVKEITVPLRQDYIRKLATDVISGHHLVCLLKYNEHVFATKTMRTLPGLLTVKFPDVLQLNDVFADFRITLEIYGMTAQIEVLPHEVKYHINLNKKSGIKTPKKKGCENRLVMPPVQSPAGPHVVRTPALVQYGFAIFSLREIKRTSWSLTQVLGVCPLDGLVNMKVNCELSVSVDYKGFLTMFEDISGFGAWHRRWCHLNGTMINYWKYPDDERKKTPIGSIDLSACSSKSVKSVPRDICARLNTMLLECERPAEEGDRESLVIVPSGRITKVRHLLSADTKEELEEWCAFLNKALTLIRVWGSARDN